MRKKDFVPADCAIRYEASVYVLVGSFIDRQRQPLTTPERERQRLLAHPLAEVGTASVEAVLAVLGEVPDIAHLAQGGEKQILKVDAGAQSLTHVGAQGAVGVDLAGLVAVRAVADEGVLAIGIGHGEVLLWKHSTELWSKTSQCPAVNAFQKR